MSIFRFFAGAGVNPKAWNLSYAQYAPPNSFSVSAQETSPDDIFFKPDGFKMYVLGGNDIHEYDLSAAWDVSSASYLQGFSLSVFITGGLFFKPDGTKMYYSSINGGDVKEYFLPTPWSVSSALYLNNYSAGLNESRGLFFKPDGSKMYLVGGSGAVVEHDLSTPWDVSSGSFLQSFSVSAQDGSPTGIFFKPDGSKMFVVGDIGDDINEYSLSTPWDVSSASYLRNFSVAAQDTGSFNPSPQGVSFKPDGLKMYVIGAVTDAVYEYNFTA